MATEEKGKTLAENAAKEYLERFAHDMMPRIAKWLATNHPSLIIDEAWEKAVDFLIPLAEAGIRTQFGAAIEASKVKKFLFEISTDMIRELSQEMRRLKDEPLTGQIVQPKNDKGATAMATPSDIWMNPKEHPGIGYHSECGARHWMVDGTRKRKGKGGADVEEPTKDVGLEFNKVPFKVFVLSGARAPEGAGEGFVPGTCACARLIADDRALYEKLEAEKAKASQPKPPKAPFFSPEFRQAASRGMEGALNGLGQGARAIGGAAKAAVQAVGEVPAQFRELSAKLDDRNRTKAQENKDKLALLRRKRGA